MRIKVNKNTKISKISYCHGEKLLKNAENVTIRKNGQKYIIELA